MEQDVRYQKAKRKVEQIKAFYVHLILYLVINAGLLALNLFVSPENLWFFWSVACWGIALLIHGLIVFGTSFFFGKKWEEKRIRKIMENEE